MNLIKPFMVVIMVIHDHRVVNTSCLFNVNKKVSNLTTVNFKVYLYLISLNKTFCTPSLGC